MNEVKVALAGQLLEQRQLGQMLKSWQVGQVLQARVLDTLPNGRLLLGVGGQQVLASSEFAVPRGTILSLQVNSLFPLPTLKVQNTPLHTPVNSTIQGPLHSPVPANTSQQLLQQQVQQLLPRQGSVSAPLLTLLNPAAKVNILSVLGVKTDVLERLNQSFSQLGLLTDLKSLQQSIAQSGLFLESDLARSLALGQQPPAGLMQNDLKAMLLRVLQQLRDVTIRLPAGALPDADEATLVVLRNQLEGALAAITLNQLAVTGPDVRPGGLWLFDMPFLVRNVLHDLTLSIEGDAKNPDSKAAQSDQWRVLVRVSLPQLGPIEAEFFLQGQRVSIAIYAQLTEGAQFLEARLDRLQVALEQCGLEVSVLRVHHGFRGDTEKQARWQPGVDVVI